MNTVVVQKRYGGEYTDVRDFVRPNDVMVQALVSSLRQQGRLTVRGSWEWIAQNITYPAGPAFMEDGHTEIRYHWSFPLFPLPRFLSHTNDFWNFPAETIRDLWGDCDDRFGLLESLIYNVPGITPSGYWCTVGTFDGEGHTWVATQAGGTWIVLETTLKRLPPATIAIHESGPYVPWFRFNRDQVSVVRTSAVPRIAHLSSKTRKIHAAYQHLITEVGIHGWNI